MLVGRVLRVLRCAERRHLEDVGADVDMHEAEAAADDVRAPEQRLHLLGRRIGGDVEVLRRQAEHEIAHRAADDERPEARLVQLLDDGAGAACDLLAPDGMIARRVDARFACRPAGHQAGEQAADHCDARMAWKGAKRRAIIARERCSTALGRVPRGSTRPPTSGRGAAWAGRPQRSSVAPGGCGLRRA